MSDTSRAIAVIPARYGSTRFPGKVLARIAGKPMVQWVYERTCQAHGLAEVLVATDHEEVRRCVAAFGGRVVMTSPHHATGSDRIAEAIQGLTADLIVNVQGDEPLIPPDVLTELVAAMRAHPQAQMGTVGVPLPAGSPDYQDPNVVKLVADADGYALYFSRAPIPYARQPLPPDVYPCRHWGLYAYQRAFLEQFVRWPQGVLERCESLEQLRALEHGARILVIRSHFQTVGVDVPADIAKAEALMARRLAAAGSQA